MDIFLTNRPSLVNHCDTITGISDHEAILVQSPIIASLKPSQHNIHIILWSWEDVLSMKNTALNLCNVFLENNTVSTNIDVLWDQFKTMCSECHNYVPSKLIYLDSIRKP